MFSISWINSGFGKKNTPAPGWGAGVKKGSQMVFGAYFSS
jgi:hypothetical protein